MPEIKTKTGLTGNQLKLIAMAAMTIDHVGLVLLPQYRILRIIGRLAFPIYAYMIAEGCTYTHNKGHYLLRMLGLGLACQVVYYVAMGSLYQCILITFSLSAALIFVMDWTERQRRVPAAAGAAAALLAAGFVCILLPTLLPGTDFAVDYGFFGVCLPVLVWMGRNRGQKLALLTLGLVLVATASRGNQWYSLLTVPLLALYSGKRGKYAIGRLFYIYYPLHLVVIYGIGLLLSR